MPASDAALVEPEIEIVRERLLAHYLRHRRDLPWRRTRDPYAVWVSEIMLQQTQVETVRPRYEQFLGRFPTVKKLAAASETQVCEAWAGLGYYRRARHLHAAARVVVQEHEGHLPQTVEGLLRLPGIGRYTAGAVASIAFGAAAPLVDGNVERVLCRLFAIVDSPRNAPTKNRLWSLAAQLVQGERPGDLNQALMEHGALVCTPTGPSCDTCVVASLCRAHAQGNETDFPAKAPKLLRKALSVAFAWVVDRRSGGVWLERRPLDGLWAGLWELPSASGPRAKSSLGARLGGASLGAAVAVVQHDLTHRRVTARVYQVREQREARKTETPNLVESESCRVFAQPLDAPLSGLCRKAIMAVQRELQPAKKGGSRASARGVE